VNLLDELITFSRGNAAWINVSRRRVIGAYMLVVLVANLLLVGFCIPHGGIFKVL
jgi:hypothetical protein